MTFKPGRIDTVLVDSYGTLVNEVSTTETLEKYTQQPTAIAHIWDLRGSIYGITSAVLDEFKPTVDRYEVSLDYALEGKPSVFPRSAHISLYSTLRLSQRSRRQLGWHSILLQPLLVPIG